MTETKLDWENLKQLKCPKCYEDLIKNFSVISGFKCPNSDCNFAITRVRLREIVEKMFRENVDNFGRAEFEEMMEGEK